ncbi:hypothetical protein BH10ACT1_BH10ACT1_21660 [soil metagenome]
MSQRRPTRFHRRPSAPGSRPTNPRKRLAAVAGAAIALVAVAALIGSGADDGRSGDRADRTRSVAGDSATSASKAAGAGAGGSFAGDSAPEPSTTMAAAMDAPADAALEQSSTGAEADAGGDVAAPLFAGAPADAKIIRTGSLQVEVAKGKFAEGSAGLTRIATGLGGFVSASEITSFEDDPSGTVTLRIPADQFDKAVAEVGKLGSVEALTTGSQDVTGEYTDVAARLKALTAEREQINLVLSRAESIPDILSVRDRLAAVQGEIEVAQGRQKVLDDQTSLSTLTVQLTEKGSPATDVTRWAWRRLAPVDGTEPAPPATVAD